MRDFERNQFLRQFHGSDAHHKGVDPITFQRITELRKFLFKWGGGWISENDCAITAATAGAQWELRIRDAKKKQHAAGVESLSPLKNLILPKGTTI